MIVDPEVLTSLISLRDFFQDGNILKNNQFLACKL